MSQRAAYPLAVLLIILLMVLYLKLNFYEKPNRVQRFEGKNILETTHVSKIGNTETSADTLLVPDDKTLNNMSGIQHMEFYLRNFVRIGSLRDGGKEICIDDFYRPKAPCLVYSFGINNQWDFDNMIVDLFGCEVHCFDPSMARPTGKVSDKVWFYKVGIHEKDWINQKKWEMKTLKTIRKDLKHENRTIDILKMDVEGAEWKAIPQMIESGALDGVKQIAVEFHFPRRADAKPSNWRDETTNIQLSCLRRIYEAGYRIIMRDRNIYNIGKLSQFKYPLTLLYEITFVKEYV